MWLFQVLSRVEQLLDQVLQSVSFWSAIVMHLVLVSQLIGAVSKEVVESTLGTVADVGVSIGKAATDTVKNVAQTVTNIVLIS